MAHGIMEDDNMFYAGREVPWHGLGTQIQESPDSKTALITAKLDWQVINKPVFVEGQQIENYVANVRNDTNKVLGIVTDRYNIVQNDEAFAFTDALIGTGNVRYETAGSLWNGKKVWMLAKMPEIEILGDKVEPYLCFANCHDGKGSIKVMVTPVRVVCQNTLNLAINGAKRSWSTKHMGDMQSKIKEAKFTLEMANNYITGLQKSADELVKISMTEKMVDEFVKDLFPINNKDSERKENNILEIRNELMNRYKASDINKFRGTGWAAINAVSDLVTHSQPKRNTSSYKENLFGKVIEGHKIIDTAYELLVA